MTDVGRVLRLEARSTTLFLAVPVLAVVGVVAAWPTLIPGVGYWQNAVSAVIGSVRVLGPLCAALAAWTAMRDDPSLGYLRGLTVRSPATVPLLDLSLLACIALPAYGIVTFVVFVKTVMHQEAGDLPVLGIAGGAAALMLQVVAGYLAGRLYPHLITMPIVGLACYLCVATGPNQVTSWSGLPTAAAIDKVDVFASVDHGLFLGRLLWSLGLCVLLVAGYLMWLTRYLWLVVPLGLALGGAAAGAARIHGYHEPVIQATFTYACRSWPLRVCVHPALRPALRSLGTAVTPLAGRLNGTKGEFTRLEQRPAAEFGAGLGIHVGAHAPGVAYVEIKDLSPGFERRAVRQVLAGLLDSGRCRDPRNRAGIEYTGLVAAWLLDERPPAISDTATAQLFAEYDEEERRAWLRAHFARFRGCALTAADFRSGAEPPVRRRVSSPLALGPEAVGLLPAAGPLDPTAMTLVPVMLGLDPTTGTYAATGAGLDPITAADWRAPHGRRGEPDPRDGWPAARPRPERDQAGWAQRYGRAGSAAPEAATADTAEPVPAARPGMAGPAARSAVTRTGARVARAGAPPDAGATLQRIRAEGRTRAAEGGASPPRLARALPPARRDEFVAPPGPGGGMPGDQPRDLPGDPRGRPDDRPGGPGDGRVDFEERDRQE